MSIDEKPTPDEAVTGISVSRLYGFCGVLLAVIFVVDLLVPLGVADTSSWSAVTLVRGVLW